VTEVPATADIATAVPALDGICVLDLGAGPAGRVAGMLLADHGARVLRVDSSDHDAHDAVGVWDRGAESVTWSSVMRAFGHGRSGGSLDVVLFGPPGSSDRRRPRHPSARRLRREDPWVITARVTAYGPRGPLAQHTSDDASLVAARAGMAAAQAGWLEGAPADLVPPVLETAAGLLLVIGLAAALLERDRTGVGAHVETSLLAAAMALSTETCVAGDAIDMLGRLRALDRRAAGVQPLYAAYECADGRWIHLGASHPNFVSRAVEVLRLDDEPSHVETAAPEPSSGSRSLYERAAARLRERSAETWVALLEAAGVPAEVVRSPQGYLDDPQVRANGITVLMNGDQGAIEQVGPPVRLSASPARVHHVDRPTRGPAPLPCGARIPPRANPAPPLARRPRGRGPLHGLRVVEVGNLIAGPLAARVLADLGADVVKIEPPTGGDLTRVAGVPAFHPLNAGKRGVALDLKDPDGLANARRLVDVADVLISNLRPGAMERLGLGHDAVAARNPGVVVGAVTAYGSGGPDAHRPGVDGLACARAGLLMIQGAPAGKPVQLNGAVADHTAGLLAATGILLALVARDRTGRGQAVETSLLDAAALLGAPWLQRRDGQSVALPTVRSQLGDGPGRRLYRAADGWVAVAARVDQGEAIATLSGLAASAPDGAALDAALEATISPWTTDEALRRLWGLGVPAQPVIEAFFERFAEDPQLRAVGAIADLGGVRMTHRWVTISGHAVGARRPAPRLGQHTRSVFATLDAEGTS
jgi:crotonobetainyl-CoA:carnitine CoA-transferase CaiB-like acyl-CoA transferase